MNNNAFTLGIIHSQIGSYMNIRTKITLRTYKMSPSMYHEPETVLEFMEILNINRFSELELKFIKSIKIPIRFIINEGQAIVVRSKNEVISIVGIKI